jgi:hypothetical protein
LWVVFNKKQKKLATRSKKRGGQLLYCTKDAKRGKKMKSEATEGTIIQ